VQFPSTLKRFAPQFWISSKGQTSLLAGRFLQGTPHVRFDTLLRFLPIQIQVWS